MNKTLTLTKDHLSLIKNIKFEAFVFDSNENKNGRFGWGIDQYSLFGGSYAMEDIAMILGNYDKYIKGTESDPMGKQYPKEMEEYMWSLYDYIYKNMEDIIKLVFQFSNEGGLSEGTYKLNNETYLWEKIN